MRNGPARNWMRNGPARNWMRNGPARNWMLDISYSICFKTPGIQFTGAAKKNNRQSYILYLYHFINSNITIVQSKCEY